MSNKNNPVYSILSYFTQICIDKKEVQCFTTDYEKRSRFFYNAKLKYPKIFKEIFFNTNGHIPYSKEIDDLLFDLKLCGLLVSVSPREKVYILSQKLREKFPKTENKKRELKLKNIAENFYSELGCDENGKIGKHIKFNGLEKIV